MPFLLAQLLVCHSQQVSHSLLEFKEPNKSPTRCAVTPRAIGPDIESKSYRDEALGTMAKDAAGKMAMTEVVLRPAIRFSGPRVPDEARLQTLHHEAHEKCFIANSVKTTVRCEPIATAKQ